MSLLQQGLLDADAGVEGAVEDVAGLQVAQLGAHERAALAGLDVLELDHLEQAVVELEGDAVLQVVGGDGRHGESLGDAGEDAAAVAGDHRPDLRLGCRRNPHDRGPARRSPRPRPASRRSVGAVRTGPRGSRPTPWPVPWGNHSAYPAGGDDVAAHGVRARARCMPAGTARNAGLAAPTSTTSYSSCCSDDGSTDDEAAGHVAVVAVDEGADVDDHRVAVHDQTVGGPVVRPSCVHRARRRRWSRSSDRWPRARACAPRAGCAPAPR